MRTVERQSAAVGDAEVSALTAGKGPPVVLLHGIPTGAAVWERVLVRLAHAGYQGLAPDLPGYGRTRLPPTADHSLAGSARLIADWLADRGSAPAWIVGHDSGGAVAQILAVGHPRSVSRLTLTNSIADGWWPAPRARFARAVSRVGGYRAAARLGLVPNAFMRWQIRRAFADAAAADGIDAVLWNGKCRDPAGRAAFERHLIALTARDTAEVAVGLGDLAVPCQLVWGTADPFQPWRGPGRRLEELLPSPAVVALDACGHFTPWECPQGLVDAMLAWAEGT